MRDTGEAFTVARRLVVPLDALRAWERRQQARERGEWERPGPMSAMADTHRRQGVVPTGTTDAPRWWHSA